MNDKEKLKLTKRKLLNISRSCSLLELSRRKIVKNLDFYQDFEEYGTRLKSLPVCLRDKLLRELTSQKFDCAFGDSIQNFEKKLKDFSFLLSLETKLIELDGLMSFCPHENLHEQLTRVVQMIAADAPNVQSLILNGRNSMAEIYILSSNFRPCYNLDQASLEAICSLSKLKKLEISMCVQVEFSDLMQICETLQLLEYVDVRINESSSQDFGSIDKFKRSFSRLKVFNFSVYELGSPIQEELTLLCIEHLPKLRLVDQWDVDVPHLLRQVRWPLETSSIMNLAVYPTALPIHLDFPEVRHLTIGWHEGLDSSSESIIDSLLSFPKVESLFVHPSLPSEKIFHRFLDRYGSNLRKLVIQNYSFYIKMGEIMSRCKKLERLVLQMAFFSSDEPLMPTQTFAELKELTWNTPIFKNSNYGQHLLQLLSAPKLEKVTFTLGRGVSIDLDVLKEVSNLIANGQILRELKSLIIYFHLRKESRDIIEVANILITNACAFLPKFTRVVLKPYGECCLAPMYNSQGEFVGFSQPGPPWSKSIYDFRKFRQANLGKFLFACRMG